MSSSSTHCPIVIAKRHSRSSYKGSVSTMRSAEMKLMREGVMKVLAVFGTRPEAIKMSPLVTAFRRSPSQFVMPVCVTGQHTDLLRPILRLFAIEPEYDLDLMQQNQSLHDVAAKVIRSLGPILASERPDWVMVQGDTTTALAAGLAAHYARIPVVHVEAGLRSGDEWQPFPEEINRKLIDHLSQLHLAPTEGARENLLREGIAPERIRVTGNSGIDAVLHVASLPFDFAASSLRNVVHNSGQLVLITAHRRESFGEPLRQICSAIRRLARRFEDRVQFVFPVHPNPNVRHTVNELLGAESNVNLLDPLEYEPFVHLMKRSTLILTDSGGIQEEAPALGVPVLVLREVTERPEGVLAGCARVVGTNAELIMRETIDVLENEDTRSEMARAALPYGDGRAAERTVQAVLEASGNLRLTAATT
jgi:UDP-N-acetylglucosamine 2-epimerase (non-hydrolysing)